MALTVVFAPTDIGELYTVPCSQVGALLSNAYLTLEEALFVVSITFWADVYVPAAGLAVGAATMIMRSWFEVLERLPVNVEAETGLKPRPGITERQIDSNMVL
jgi:hypothetical protein